jgi:hypothetical protein
MNPLLEKYDELYGPKIEPKEEKDIKLEFYNNDTIIGASSTASYIYGSASNDTISLGTPFPSGYCYGEGGDDDHIYVTSNPSIKSSLMIDGKDIKDVIKEEVERQLKEQREITHSQTQSVLTVLEKVRKGEVRIKSYSETVSHDLGGSTTHYTIELEK